MVFAWLKRRRRAKILAQPFPEPWEDVLGRRVAHYAALSAEERHRLRQIVQVLVAEKHWEGCGGLVVSDEMKVTIAALAGLLLLGIDHDYFPGLLSILIYPAAYAVPDRAIPGTPLFQEEEDHLGEAWYRGPVILSWEDVIWDCEHPGEGTNLVWHEFAHQLDMQDREVNGTPQLGSVEAARRWHEVMTQEFERLAEDAEAGRLTLLDQYGASDEAEFFSVATEAFFDRPLALRSEHPRLYELLGDYYRQDPAARLPLPAEPPRRRPPAPGRKKRRS